jgi:hypothetical protein
MSDPIILLHPGQTGVFSHILCNFGVLKVCLLLSYEIDAHRRLVFWRGDVCLVGLRNIIRLERGQKYFGFVHGLGLRRN